MELRRFQSQDAAAVVDLHQVALRDTGAFAERGEWDIDLDNIEAAYLMDGEFIVGFDNDRLVAMGALKRLAPDRAEIKRMRVHPDCQRRGLGKEVLDRLEQAAQELGVSMLVLDTTSVQSAAVAFYAKNGYVETGREFRAPFEIVSFEKALASKRQIAAHDASP